MRRLLLLLIAVPLLLGGAVMMVSDSARVRVRLVLLKVTGRLPALSLHELYDVIRPGVGFDIDGLAHTHNPQAALRLPDRFAAESLAGKTIFESRCAQCHGGRGEGGAGPTLTGGRKHGTTDWSTYTTMREGLPATAMVATGLSFEDSWRVIAYIRNLSAAAASGAVATAVQRAPVVPADLAAADTATGEWLTYAGGWSGRRNKDIPEITAQSLHGLRLAWANQLPRDPTVSQSVPIVTRGLLLVTSALEVIALDAKTGTVAWRFQRDLPVDVKLCCSRANRGVAVNGDLVFVGTLDAWLYALDLSTGRVRWKVQVGDARLGFSITSAPLAIGDKIVMGISGGEFGTRGYLTVYEAATGKQVWRFYTVPQAGETGSDSWPKGVTMSGGPTWVPGAYDPATGTLYWGVGNPSPDFNASMRTGDNLYTNSVIALDFETGKLKWTFQFTPGDPHDWDSAQTPILAEVIWGGRQRSVILWANRNAYFYVLDRLTGEFLSASPYARQSWNEGFTKEGRPKPLQSAVPTPQGVVVYPGVGGATNWWPATYSQGLNLMFIAARENGSLFFSESESTGETGMVLGGRTQPVPGEANITSVVAMDVATGQVRWKTAAPDNASAAMGGLLAIGDRLVLGGQSNTFFALDSRTGERVWQTTLGAPIQGAPVVFRDGKAVRIAVTAGAVLFVFEVPAS